MQQPDYTLLDRSEITMMMFYLRRDWRPPSPGATDHAVTVGEGVEVSCRFYAHDKAEPSILYFHGNGEVVSDYDDVAPIYHHYGINLFVADYRGYGVSSGRPSFSTMVADTHQVFYAFRDLLAGEGYSDRLYVMGRSLGATSALELAAHYPDQLRGLILESGAGGTGGWSRWVRASDDPARWEELQRLHEEKLRSIRLPLLTIHGEVDEMASMERALELRELVSSQRKELLVIPGAGHNDFFYVGMERYMDALRGFVNS